MTKRMTARDALVAYRAATIAEDKDLVLPLEDTELSDRVAIGFTARNGASYPLPDDETIAVTLSDLLFDVTFDQDGDLDLGTLDQLIARL